jgi:hypothetical protein
MFFTAAGREHDVSARAERLDLRESSLLERCADLAAQSPPLPTEVNGAQESSVGRHAGIQHPPARVALPRRHAARTLNAAIARETDLEISSRSQLDRVVRGDPSAVSLR